MELAADSSLDCGLGSGCTAILGLLGEQQKAVDGASSRSCLTLLGGPIAAPVQTDETSLLNWQMAG
jgi:hypothetical protein